MMFTIATIVILENKTEVHNRSSELKIKYDIISSTYRLLYLRNKKEERDK